MIKNKRIKKNWSE